LPTVFLRIVLLTAIVLIVADQQSRLSASSAPVPAGSRRYLLSGAACGVQYNLQAV